MTTQFPVGTIHELSVRTSIISFLVQYMYLEAETEIDREPVNVKIDIRKAPQKINSGCIKFILKKPLPFLLELQRVLKQGFLNRKQLQKVIYHKKFRRQW